MKRLDIDQARLHAGTPLFCLFIDRPMPKEDCPDKWEGSICFAVAFICRRILCRVLFASARSAGEGELPVRPGATLCQTGGWIRNNLLPRTAIAVRRSDKGIYDLIIAATTNPQARMTTR
ncbi:hypothetical protein ACQZ46_08495 [Agrobacterium salinitolerans]